MSKTYRLQELYGKVYKDFSQSYSEFPVEYLHFPEDLQELEILPEYSRFEIPDVICELVNDFCQTYPEVEFTKLLCLIAASQRLYLNYYNTDFKDPMFQELEKEKKEFLELFALLKKFQFGDRNFLQRLHFKNEKHSLMLKSFWTVSDVYKAMIAYYDLDVVTAEAFDDRTAEVLQEKNKLKIKSAMSHVKMIIIQAFCKFLENLEINDSQLFSFIGVFLNCAQIPMTRKKFLLSPVFEHNVSETSNQTIRNYISRPPKTHL